MKKAMKMYFECDNCGRFEVDLRGICGHCNYGNNQSEAASQDAWKRIQKQEEAQP